MIPDRVRVNPEQCDQAACIAVANFPEFVAVVDNAVWVASTAQDGEWTATRIDPSTNEVVGHVPLGGAAEDLAAGLGYIWAVVQTDMDGDKSKWELVGIDSATNTRIVDSIPIAGNRVGEHAIAVGGSFVWITGSNGLLYRFDPASQEIKRFELGGYLTDYGPEDGPLRVTADNGTVWVASTSGSILRLDPSTGEPQGDSIEVGWNVYDIVVGYDRVWVTQQTPRGREQISVVDAERGTPAREPIELMNAIPAPPVVGLGSIWVLQGDFDNDRRSHLVRVDAETEQVEDVVPVQVGSFSGLDVGANAAWVVGGKLSADMSTVLRIEPGS